MSENGKIIWRMEKVTIIFILVLTIQAIGLKINNMDMVGKTGLTIAHMKVVTNTV